MRRQSRETSGTEGMLKACTNTELRTATVRKTQAEPFGEVQGGSSRREHDSGRGLEPHREAWGLALQPVRLLTIQSRHDGLAQREHQPQRGAEEEEAGYLKVKAGAGALRPILCCSTVPWCLCLQWGIARLRAATAEPVGAGMAALRPLQPIEPRGAAGSRGAPARHCCTCAMLPPGTDGEFIVHVKHNVCMEGASSPTGPLLSPARGAWMLAVPWLGAGLAQPHCCVRPLGQWVPGATQFRGDGLRALQVNKKNQRAARCCQAGW